MAVKLSRTAREIAANIRAKAKVPDGNQRVLIGINDAHIAQYAQYNEFGWTWAATRNQHYFFTFQGMPLAEGALMYSPPRPFLRGTLKAEGKNWSKVFAAVMRANDGVSDLRRALTVVGQQAIADVSETINRGGTKKEKFPERSEFTLKWMELGLKNHKRDGTGNIDKKEALTLTGKLASNITYWFD